ncbi:MAG TPA: right-handed parallel beta-helix repeat-containing protein [Usitatibacter sp.]|nr:right-handed parallel beta-helix repeat-containing protein [Usitatibacter sp.]
MKGTLIRFVLLLAASLVAPLCAHATGVFRAYLASYGSDANPGCSVSAPCRLLPAALAAVADGGEVWMLDSANYNAGTVSVSKSVSVLALPGQVGSIVAVAGGAALNIGGGLNVVLRNLVIVNNAANPGTDGIVVSGSSTVTVEQSVISVPNGTAISMAAGGVLSVDHTSIRDSNNGVRGAGNAVVDISHTKFANIPIYAVWLDGSTASTTVKAGVTDSTFSNVHIALFCWTQAGTATTRGTMTRSTVSNSVYGVASDVAAMGGIAECSAGMSMLDGVDTPFQQSGGTTGTQGNNLVRNGGPNGGTLTNVGSM